MILVKICIFKHKKLYNNALISFITFFLLFLFLIIPNEDWYGWGEYSHNLSFLTRLLDNLSYIDKIKSEFISEEFQEIINNNKNNYGF